jgi:hypothetical protein
LRKEKKYRNIEFSSSFIIRLLFGKIQVLFLFFFWFLSLKKFKKL